MIVTTMRINENGPSSNYRTIDNDPISHFHDSRVEVEIYPSSFGKFGVNVTCELLDYKSGLQEFYTEQEANLFAMNLSNKLISILDSRLAEAVISRLILR